MARLLGDAGPSQWRRAGGARPCGPRVVVVVLLEEGRSQIEGFRTVMNRIMSGQRIGHATDRWNQRWAMLDRTGGRTESQCRRVGDSDQLQNLWIARDDARNHIVFGDPAVRLRAGDLR